MTPERAPKGGLHDVQRVRGNGLAGGTSAKRDHMPLSTRAPLGRANPRMVGHKNVIKTNFYEFCEPHQGRKIGGSEAFLAGRNVL
jgi:hypothetical protein